MFLFTDIHCCAFVGTVLAYGQTSSGKTYTMRGTDNGSEMGIIPRCIGDIYSRIENVRISSVFVVTTYYYIHYIRLVAFFTRTTGVSRHQKGNTNLDLLEQ